jgi:hypothetical protein
MALPPTVRVKLSSEAAGAISITPVVVQELPVRELAEHMLGITGQGRGADSRDSAARHLVSGASRFRWAGWEAEVEACGKCWRRFPMPIRRSLSPRPLRARRPDRRATAD